VASTEFPVLDIQHGNLPSGFLVLSIFKSNACSSRFGFKRLSSDLIIKQIKGPAILAQEALDGRLFIGGPPSSNYLFISPKLISATPVP